MTDLITIAGLVTTTPRHIVTNDGASICSFRLATNQRRFDRAQNTWVDGDTNWYTIVAFRQLSENVARSVEKGQRVIVSGRLRLHEWEGSENSGTSIEVEAETIGHDLAFGTATFVRTPLKPIFTSDEKPLGEEASVVSVAEQTA